MVYLKTNVTRQKPEVIHNYLNGNTIAEAAKQASQLRAQ